MNKRLRKILNSIGNKLSNDLVNPTVLDKYKKENNLVNHAIDELTIAGYYDSTKEGPNKWIREQVIETIAVLASHNNSGSSIGLEISLFNKLAKFGIISPLTLSDDEFIEVSNNSFQNKRCSDVFKENNKIHWLNAFTKKVIKSKYFGKDEIIEQSDGMCWSGIVFEMKDGIATGNGFHRCYIKQENINKGLIPENTIHLPCLEVEVQKDNWLMFVDVNSEELKKLKESYDIDYIINDKLIDKEVVLLTDSYGY